MSVYNIEAPFCIFLLSKRMDGNYYMLLMTENFEQGLLPIVQTTQILYSDQSFDTSITGNISNNLITYDKPASIPINAVVVNDMNICSDNKAGCFSTNIRIGNDTIKAEGRLRTIKALWNVYALTKWDNSQKELCIVKYQMNNDVPTILDRKMFAVQIADFNWSIHSGMGEEVDYTLNLKVVDQKTNNPLNG